VKLPVMAGETDETMSAFVERVRTGGRGRAYTLGVGLPGALAPEFPPAYDTVARLGPPQLWFGAGSDPREPVTELHRDLANGMLGHVYGRKRFVIFPPYDRDALYARANYYSFQCCWAAPHRPDYARYPKLKQTSPIEVVLEPGDLLVQPLGWFHSVYSLDGMTMSVSYFLF
jgi:hypothetical protein